MENVLSQCIAVIADIHGNRDALVAVLEDIDTLGVTTIINLGDHLSGPLAARDTADLILSRKMVNIRGNHDRCLIEIPPNQMGLSDKAAFDQLTEHHLDWLRSLPPTEVLDGELFLCHGTPRDDSIYWLEDVSDSGAVSLRPYEAINGMASGLQYELMLCGHTHLPRTVWLSDNRMVVNPGSVGLPGYDDLTPVPHVMQTGTPDACYVLLEKRKSQWKVTYRHVPYDSKQMVRLAEKANRPEWARALATGWAFP